MYTLYYSPGACSMSVHVTLEELGIEFEAKEVNLKKGEHKSDWYLEINPRGQVGALQTEDGLMSENAAMIIYLNDKHGHKVIPADGFARGKALQWLMFVNSTLHPAYGKAKFASEYGEEASKQACDDVQAKWDAIERELERNDKPFLAGDEPTAGDIYATVCANWDFLEHLPTFGPRTQKLINAVSSRPAYQRAIATEQIEYKAAA
ncbi:MAG: glutathione S-transferase family protein [Alphaproteobacteria bacterium]|nr:glutathione S-transferase family protein [Alphaproteobacteria bacterium]